MEELKSFLRGLADEDAREQFAVDCGTTLGHLRNVSNRQRQLAPEVCVAVERESKNRLRRWDLRPDDWHLIWPELRKLRGAPEVDGAKA